MTLLNYLTHSKTRTECILPARTSLHNFHGAYIGTEKSHYFGQHHLLTAYVLKNIRGAH